MGVIIPLSKVRRMEVPSKDDFEGVKNHLLERVYEESSIVGALLLGSLISGDVNRRSDMDCLVLCESSKIRAARNVLCDVIQYAHSRHVPLKFIPYDTEGLVKGYHSLTRSFMAHLQFVCENGGLIKGNPLDYLKFTQLNEVQEYTVHKIEKIFKGRLEFEIMSEEEKFHFLQKAIEGPIHLARKMMWFNDVPYHLCDKKSEALTCYNENIGGREAELLQKIMQVDEHYSQTLESLIHGQRNGEHDYKNALSIIEDSVADVERFFRLNLNHW